MTSPSGRQVALRSTVLGAVATAIANAGGIVVVFVLLAFVLPVPTEAEGIEVILRNLVFASIYVGVAGAVGLTTGVIDSWRRLEWLREDRPPDARERHRTVRIPLANSVRQSLLWAAAAGLFGVADGLASGALLGVEIALTVLMGGLTTTALTYLLQERFGRQVVAHALRGQRLRRAPGAGVAWRTVLTWGLGTALPLAGLTLLAGLALGLEIDRSELALATFVLGLTALATGLVSMLIFARSVADPLRRLRQTLVDIERGHLDVDVEITATTEVGVLQAGVGRMLEGLRERDRIRDLFGRHVGEDIARRAMEEGVELGGEERQAVMLFIDVVDSTRLAEDRDPADVLHLLNDFFGIVVEEVRRADGFVNKFMGDAALAVWGTPVDLADPATAALQTARRLQERLAEEVAPIDAGIGVAGGTVVAGNLGASSRLEYTVIGDPVNVAARLAEAAKSTPGLTLAEAALVQASSAEERACWADVGATTLRGRSVPTALAEPVSPGRS